jgi:hypothetical protein
LRELHGVFQIAMGWEGIHLYQFSLRVAARNRNVADAQSRAVSDADYSSGLGSLGPAGPHAHICGMVHIDMRSLPAAAQEERRRQVIGLREGGLTYQAVDEVAVQPNGLI